MRRALALLALMFAPAAHAAACLDGSSIARGVVFTRADGHKGLARGTEGNIAIDYAVNTGTAWLDKRTTRLGIYDLTWAWTPTDDHYVGGGPGGYWEFRYGGKAPVPKPGSTWKTTLRTTEIQDYGTESGPEKTRSRAEVTFSYLAAQEVKLSGCKYTAIPVEMRGSDAKLIRRWMYFPDLGFGLETRMTSPEDGRDLKLGLTAMTPAK